MELLYDHCDDLKIQFIQRCSLTETSTLWKYIMSFLINRNANLVTSETYNLNRGGHLSDYRDPTRTRSGVCPYGPGINGGIVTGGDVLYCPFHDFERKGVMGNIYKKSLKEIYCDKPWQELIKNHQQNNYQGICENCDEAW